MNNKLVKYFDEEKPEFYSFYKLYYIHIILIGIYISNLRDARGERVAYIDSAGA
jgi:hypothetical protein